MKFLWMLAAIMVAIGGGAATAQTPVYEYVARTIAPSMRSGNVVAGALTWTCAQSECRISGPWLAPGVGACALLAGQVGRIASYGRDGPILNETQLAQCNANVPVTESSAQVRLVQPQLSAPSRVASSPQTGSVAGAIAAMPIEDGVMYMFMLTAEDARNDLHSLLEEMDATRRQRDALREHNAQTRARTAELRAATAPTNALQTRTPTTADVQSNPCAAPTLEAWRVCVGQIEARLTSAQIPADDRRRLEPMLASLRAELDAISGDDAASRQHFDRSRQLAVDIMNDLEAVAARRP